MHPLRALVLVALTSLTDCLVQRQNLVAASSLPLVSSARRSQQGSDFVVKRGNVCTIEPSGGDDSPAIISAFKQCNRDSVVVFQNKTYHVERIMSTHGLKNVEVQNHGTLLVLLLPSISEECIVDVVCSGARISITGGPMVST